MKTLQILLVALLCSLTLCAQPLRRPVRQHPDHHTYRLPDINEHRLKRLEKMRQQNLERRHGAGPLRVQAKPQTKKGLVLLVQFPDMMMGNGAKTAWTNRFNQPGFNLDNHIGSVRDYFIDQSYGLLTIDFDVVGPLTLSKGHDYYGTAPNSGIDDRAPEMVIEALALADPLVNYADYDWDGDGEVEQVYVVYAGVLNPDKVRLGYIWPHEWNLYSANSYGVGTGIQRLDGVILDTYAVSNELADVGVLDGIGTACHEFSHCLGFPDFYDVDYTGGTACQYWDLLDGGSYNGPENIGEIPCPYTAYERWVAGWIDLTPLTNAARVTDMPCINKEGVAYIIYNSGNKDEYYILENRQKVTYGTSNYGHGLMVWHIDYDESAWYSNSVNSDKNHQRVTFIPADGKVGVLTPYGDGTYYYDVTAEDESGDPYPGTKKVTSVPKLSWYTAEKGGTKVHPNLIHSITESEEGKISFTYGDYAVMPSPEVLEPTDCFRETFTANWNPVEGAVSYSLQVTSLTGTAMPVTLIDEDFADFSSVASNATINASTLNQYTKQPGWNMQSVFGTADASVRVSSGNNVGVVTTPLLTNKAGSLQVDFEARSYGTDASSVVVNIMLGSSRVISRTVPLSDGSKAYSLTFDGVPAGCKVQFTSTATKKRYYLESVKIVDVTDAGSVTRIYDGITATSFTISPTDALLFCYCVQAVNQEGKSDWSEWIDVDLSTATGLAGQSAVMAKDVKIYDLQGRRLQSVPRKGLYLQGGKLHLVR